MAERARTRKSGALIVGVCLIALGLVARGAYAGWTGTGTATHATGTGTVSLTIGGANPEDESFDVDVTDMVAGDFITRPLALNVGPTDLSAISMSTSAPVSSLLDTDHSFFAAVYSCSVPFELDWVGGIPVVTSCPGAVSEQNGGSDVVFGPLLMSNMNLSAGAVNYVIFIMQLGDVDASYIGESSTIRVTFTGTARAGHGQ